MFLQIHIFFSIRWNVGSRYVWQNAELLRLLSTISLFIWIVLLSLLYFRTMPLWSERDLGKHYLYLLFKRKITTYLFNIRTPCTNHIVLRKCEASRSNLHVQHIVQCLYIRSVIVGGPVLLFYICIFYSSVNFHSELTSNRDSILNKGCKELN